MAPPIKRKGDWMKFEESLRDLTGVPDVVISSSQMLNAVEAVSVLVDDAE